MGTGAAGWIASAACRCPEGSTRCVPDAQVISHYGRHSQRDNDCEFYDAPHPSKVPGMSVQAEKLDAAEMCRRVLGVRTTDGDVADACVRYTTTEKLRSAGFSIAHTPGRLAKSRHCTVIWSENRDYPMSNPVSPWPPGVSKLFRDCFNVDSGREEP